MSRLFAAVGKTGRLIYATLYRNGQLWNNTSLALENFNAANWDNYEIHLVEQGITGAYIGTIPTSLPPGSYLVIYRECLDSDCLPSDKWVALEAFDWNGVNRIDSFNLADRFLLRNLGGGGDGGRTVQDALRGSRNKVLLDHPSPGQMTVFKEDDVTVAYVATYTRSSNELGPISGVDPV